MRLSQLSNWYRFSAEPVQALAEPTADADLGLRHEMFVVSPPNLEILGKRHGEPELVPLGQSDSRIVEELIRSGASELVASPGLISMPGEDATFSMQMRQAPDPEHPGTLKMLRGIDVGMKSDVNAQGEPRLQKLKVTSTSNGIPSTFEISPDAAPGIYMISQPVAWTDAQPALVLIRFEGMAICKQSKPETSVGN